VRDTHVGSVRFIIKRRPDGRADQDASTELWRQVEDALRVTGCENSSLEKVIVWPDVYRVRVTLTESSLLLEKGPNWQPLP
jgi:hypothetical protein